MTENEYMNDNGANEQPPVTPPAGGETAPEEQVIPTDLPDQDSPEGENPEVKTFEQNLAELFEQEAERDPELVERIKSGKGILGDREKTPEELIQAVKSAGIPKSMVASVLGVAGHSEEVINQVLTDPDLPEDPVPQQETEEETQQVEEAMSPEGALSEGEDLAKEHQELEEKGDHATDHEIEEHNKKVSKWKEKMNEFLFDGDRGLLRPENRVRRLAVKPTVSILLAIMVMYLASLSALTRKSAKKLG